jgi:hypothetical protein
MKSYDGTSYTVDMTANGVAKATVVTNVWQRFSDYRAAASRVHIALRNSGVQDTADLLVWGGQLEAVGNTAPTTNIKTEGSTVTRLADECNNAGTSAEFNDSEGVLYCEMYALDDDLTDRRISISDGTTSNSVVIGYSTTTNQIEVDVIDGGVSQSSMTYSVADIKVGTKIAIKYKVNDCALWVSGVERATDVSATANDFYGKVKDIRVYTTALSDVELTALTT